MQSAQSSAPIRRRSLHNYRTPRSAHFVSAGESTLTRSGVGGRYADRADSAKSTNVASDCFVIIAVRRRLGFYWLAMFSVRLQKSPDYCRRTRDRLHEGYLLSVAQ